MPKTYKKNIALLMIVLILSIPFYISSAFAQETAVGVPDPVQSCIDRNQETYDLVEFLDSGPIKTLESVASTLYFTCSAWATVEATVRAFHVATGFCSDFTCKIDPSCTTFQGEAICGSNDVQAAGRESILGIFENICSLAECALCQNNPGSLSPANAVQKAAEYIDKSKEVEGFQTKAGEFINKFHLSPYDNIYVAVGCFCPVAVLFNLRKLKTIYQTHNCCIEQACSNGISIESCDRQLSEATCMYWEGSIIISIIKIVMSLVSMFVSDLLFSKIEELLAGSRWVQAIRALLNAYTHIQALEDKWRWMSQTFSEPTCEDLNFADIKERVTPGLPFCLVQEVDLNNDGIADRIDTVCPS